MSSNSIQFCHTLLRVALDLTGWSLGITKLASLQKSAQGDSTCVCHKLAVSGDSHNPFLRFELSTGGAHTNYGSWLITQDVLNRTPEETYRGRCSRGYIELQDLLRLPQSTGTSTIFRNSKECLWKWHKVTDPWRSNWPLAPLSYEEVGKWEIL